MWALGSRSLYSVSSKSGYKCKLNEETGCQAADVICPEAKADTYYIISISVLCGGARNSNVTLSRLLKTAT